MLNWASSRPEVKPVAKAHGLALLVVLGVFLAAEIEVVEAARRGRAHAHYVHVEAAVGVVVAKDVGPCQRSMPR